MSTAPQKTIAELLDLVDSGTEYDLRFEESANARQEIEQRFAALEADSIRWRTSGPLDKLFQFVQANVSLSGPLSGHPGETYAAVLLRCLPSLLADANRFALLRMVSLEPNEALRDLMLDAMDKLVANDAENKPLTVENFNAVFDTAIVECNRIRSEYANPT